MKFLSKSIWYGFAHHTKICIIGGGTAGVNVSAHLLRSNINPRDITIFEPAHYHYFQPGWTFVGHGQIQANATREVMEKVVPDKIHLVKQRVKMIQPEGNIIITDKNHEYSFDHLIIASGFFLDWEKVKGAKQLLEDPLSNVCSIYDYNYAQKTYSLGSRFKGGKAIFTEAKLPIKCAGAPQKILYLWTTDWKKKHILMNPPELIKSSPTMFMVPKYSDALLKLAKQKGIKPTFQHDLIEITRDKAIFEHVVSKEKLQKQYDFLHVVPPMSPPQFIADSGLGNLAGFVDVNDHTLRHNKYPNIWSLGDCSSLLCSKTAAAVFSQTPVLIKNLLETLEHPEVKQKKASQLPAKYSGYSSCPVMVGGKKAMLAEFLYDKKVDESFFSDQQKPRYFFYYLIKYFFPFAYWKLMPRGLWLGRRGIRWSQKL